MRIVDITLAVAVMGAAAGLWQGSATGLAGILPSSASAGQARGADEHQGSRWCTRLVWLRLPAVRAAHRAP
jgi:hypothetical protein